SPARPGFRGSCRRRQTASRGSNSEFPWRRPARTRATCRDAGDATAIAECDEVLAEDANLKRQVFQIVRIGDWLPKAAHVFAAGCVRGRHMSAPVFPRHLAVMATHCSGS